MYSNAFAVDVSPTHFYNVDEFVQTSIFWCLKEFFFHFRIEKIKLLFLVSQKVSLWLKQVWWNYKPEQIPKTIQLICNKSSLSFPNSDQNPEFRIWIHILKITLTVNVYLTWFFSRSFASNPTICWNCFWNSFLIFVCIYCFINDLIIASTSKND